MLLGIGGVRAVRAYCGLTGTPQPEVFHANEGHAGFQGIERIRELTEAHALALPRGAAGGPGRHGLHHAHARCPAGIDRFPKALIERYFAGFGVPLHELLALGAEEDPTKFNMAHMGLRLGQRANGVSRAARPRQPGHVQRPVAGLRRGRRADRLDHQRRARPDVDRPRAGRDGHPDLQPGRPGRGRRRRCTSTASTRSPPATCGAIRRTLRGRLVEEVRRRIRETALSRGATEAEVGWTETAFDPDVLTIGFARRVPSYKRLTLMLRDPERLKALLLDPERPIQLIIAGKSHPADDGGKQLIQQMVALRRRPGDPAPDRVPARLRHRHGPLPLLGLRRLAEQPAAPAGGLRHVGHEGRAQRRAEPLHPRRLVGRVVRRPERLGDPDRRRRRRRRPARRGRGAGDLRPARQPGAAAVLRARRATASPPAGWRWCGTRCGRPARRCWPPGWCATTCRTLYVPAAGSARAMAGDGYAPAREEAAWRAHLLHNWHDGAGRARRGDRRGGHPGDRLDARPARRGRAAGPGAGRRPGAGRLRPGGRRRRAARRDHGADGARAHRRLAALVHRHRCRWSGPARSATPCACCRTPSAWPTRPSSAW